MSDSQILIIIIVACLIIMGVAIVAKKTHIIAGIILKSALGLLGFSVLNDILTSLTLNLSVGLNLGTALTVGFLGLPGFALLYILAIYDHFIS